MLYKDNHIFIGMQLDLSPTKHKPEFMCDAHNVRITPSDKEDTYLSLTNEKGTLKVTLSLNLSGYYLGHCTASVYNETLNKDEDIIIVFCTNPGTIENPNESPDSIYKITLNDAVLKPVDVLYNGNLNFSIEHPIETFFISEAIDINKVYWNDGYNQPRVINLDNVKYDSQYNKVDPSDETTWILEDIRNTQFDFVPTLNLEESITIERQSLGGLFSPGVIQYAFSYYNKFGLLSNIFYTSQLNYIMFDNRGGNPDEKVPNSFKITIENWLDGFDYLRIYSIHRTTLDAVPLCKIVLDIDLREITDTSIVFVDNGLIGEFTDPALFTYIGGLNIIAQTWDLKDNTLFLGNITLKRKSIATITINDNNLNTSISDYLHDNKDSILGISLIDIPDGMYPAFKYGEEYRVGVLAQYLDGSWSEPVWIGDIEILPVVRPMIISGTVKAPVITCTFPSAILNALKLEGYKNLRGLCVFPRSSERTIVGQGILCPTVITNTDSKNNVKNLNSWFFRPFVSSIDLQYPANKHGEELRDEFSLSNLDGLYFIDYSKLLFYSPDIEFNSDLQELDKDSLSIKLIGGLEFNDILVSRDLTVASPAKLKTGGYIKDIDTNIVIGTPQWRDGIVAYKEQTSSDPESHELLATDNVEVLVDYLLYPWLASGPINNDIAGNVPATSVLRTNILSILLNSDSNFEDYLLLRDTFQILGQKVIDNTEEILNIVDNQDGSTFKYQDTVDTTLMGVPYKFATSDYSKYIDPNSSQFLQKEALYNFIPVQSPLNEADVFTNIMGESKFITMKYKSSRHLVLNTEDVVLPTMNSKEFFMFNGKIINNIVYYKVPSYGNNLNLLFNDTLKEQTGAFSNITSASDTVYPNDFGLLVASYVSKRGGLKSYYYDSILMEEVSKANGDPFLIIVDLDNFNLARNNYSKKLLGVASSFEFSNYYTKATLLVVDYAIGSRMNHLELVNKQIKVLYITNNLEEIAYFSPIYTQVDGNCWIENTDAAGSAWIGFNAKYPSKLQPIIYSDTTVNTRITRVPDYTIDTEIDEDNTNSCWDTVQLEYIKDALYAKGALEIIQPQHPHTPHLFICDIVRNSVQNKFGGTSYEALKSNLWIPSGEAKSIDWLLDSSTQLLPPPETGTTTVQNMLTLDRGDTWFNKYCCLKVYPYANTDENQIINKASFYCESRNNLYGIYDKDKPSAQLFINKDSFNKFNYIYNQSNNFFNYRILDKEFYTRDNFPYSFFWTKEKVNTAEIDNYNNLNLVSSLDVNSKGGEISKIITHNGLIYCFQPDGISRILFNSRVLIPVSDGVPIEIANSAKLEGVSSITNTIGCSNKWAAISTNSGLFFLDNRRKGLFLIGDEGFPQNLTAQLNMSNWFSKHNLDKWGKDSSGNWIGTKLCDDYNGNDVYFIKENDNNNEGALVYSKRIGLFTSFMSYGETDSIFNAGEYLYAFKTINGEVGLYKMNSGDYNYFFDLYEPFDFTFISAGDSESGGPTTDKTFTNVELRAAFSNDKYFDYILSKNDYQDTGVCVINKNILATNRHFSRGDTARKFRIWRTDIPRVLEGNKRTLNRVRNIWTKIKLGITKQSSSNFKMELHDINVLYHI